VAVHLDGPAVPVEPFIEDPASPTTWRLPAAQAEPPADDGNDWVPVLETVVTLGRTADGAWLFIDLESLGAVSVDGDRDDVSALVRSFVAELALQPAYHCVDLTIVGDIETPTITEQGILTAERLDEPLSRQLHRLADDTASYLDTEQALSTHAARARGLPRDGLVANLVAVGRGADPVLLHRLAEATMPGGRGLALVALDPLLDPAHQLVVRDHHIDVPHLSLTVEAARLTLDDLQTVDGLLTREPDTVTITEKSLAGTAPEPVVVDEPDWRYVVRVFADLRVETRDGDVISFRYGDPGVPNENTNRGPELIAYLALVPSRSATTDQIRDHLWWGRPVKRRTVENLISGTRRVLGGADYLTRVERGAAQGIYSLTVRVVTDIDLVQAALAHARATAADDPEAASHSCRPSSPTSKPPPSAPTTSAAASPNGPPPTASPTRSNNPSSTPRSSPPTWPPVGTPTSSTRPSPPSTPPSWRAPPTKHSPAPPCGSKPRPAAVTPSTPATSPSPRNSSATTSSPSPRPPNYGLSSRTPARDRLRLAPGNGQPVPCSTSAIASAGGAMPCHDPLAAVRSRRRVGSDGSDARTCR
jgi:hypothetical protein